MGLLRSIWKDSGKMRICVMCPSDCLATQTLTLLILIPLLTRDIPLRDQEGFSLQREALRGGCGRPLPPPPPGPLPPPHMGWGVGRGSKQPNPPKQELVSMVIRVPGEGGCSRSSCPTKYPTQAPEPELMPTQHPELLTHLPALGAEWMATNTHSIVLGERLLPVYYHWHI